MAGALLFPAQSPRSFLYDGRSSMPLPSFLVSASVLICERILSEADHVLSVIRMVDVFNVVSPPSGPDPLLLFRPSSHTP